MNNELTWNQQIHRNLACASICGQFQMGPNLGWGTQLIQANYGQIQSLKNYLTLSLKINSKNYINFYFDMLDRKSILNGFDIDLCVAIADYWRITCRNAIYGCIWKNFDFWKTKRDGFWKKKWYSSIHYNTSRQLCYLNKCSMFVEYHVVIEIYCISY